MSDRLALANAIEDAGIERSKAQRVASVIFDAIHDNVATKADVQALGAELKAEITTQVGSLRAELKSDIAASAAAGRGEIASVRALLVSETARLDTRIERLDATVKAQPNAIMLRLGALMVVLTGIVLAALRYLPPPGAPPAMPQPILNARALKCTIVLDPAEVAQIVAPDGKPRTVIAIRLPDRRVSADLNAKSVRKAVAAISEHGPDGVAVIIQGKLIGDTISEAGIVAQPKVRLQTAAQAA